MSIVKDEGENELLEKQSLQRLERAWNCLFSNGNELLNKARQHSIEEGQGISIFKFLRPSKRINDPQHNCEYYYGEKDTFHWHMMINSIDDDVKNSFLTAYTTGTFVICVSIPESELGDSTIQQLKIFRYSDNSEVRY